MPFKFKKNNKLTCNSVKVKKNILNIPFCFNAIIIPHIPLKILCFNNVLFKNIIRTPNVQITVLGKFVSFLKQVCADTPSKMRSPSRS